MKRLSKLTRQQAKHQGIELIIEGSDGGFLISQAAAKIVKRLGTLQPNWRPAREQRNDLGHWCSDPQID